MSYRNDHDAALARIDALEAELGKNSDARARFTTLEQQLATAKAERDRMREALAKQDGNRSSFLIPAALGGLALLAVGGIGLAIHAAGPKRIDSLTAPTPTLLATPDTRTEILMKCVAQLDIAVRDREALGPACLASIRTQANDLTLGDDIHAILGDWYAAESKLAASPDAIAQRDALVTRIHAYVIPSYTR